MASLWETTAKVRIHHRSVQTVDVPAFERTRVAWRIAIRTTLEVTVEVDIDGAGVDAIASRGADVVASAPPDAAGAVDSLGLVEVVKGDAPGEPTGDVEAELLPTQTFTVPFAHTSFEVYVTPTRPLTVRVREASVFGRWQLVTVSVIVLAAAAIMLFMAV